jgi:hypothetical protein
VVDTLKTVVETKLYSTVVSTCFPRLLAMTMTVAMEKKKTEYTGETAFPEKERLPGSGGF